MIKQVLCSTARTGRLGIRERRSTVDLVETCRAVRSTGRKLG